MSNTVGDGQNHGWHHSDTSDEQTNVGGIRIIRTSNGETKRSQKKRDQNRDGKSADKALFKLATSVYCVVCAQWPNAARQVRHVIHASLADHYTGVVSLLRGVTVILPTLPYLFLIRRLQRKLKEDLIGQLRGINFVSGVGTYERLWGFRVWSGLFAFVKITVFYFWTLILCTPGQQSNSSSDGGSILLFVQLF